MINIKIAGISLCLLFATFTSSSEESVINQSSNSLAYCQLEECVNYFKKFKVAAKRGHAGAMSTLAQFYYTGYGTEPDESKAITFFKKASRYGDSAAQYKLGVIHIMSKHNKDIKESIKYLNKAAKKDYKAANLLLGVLYYNNQFMPQNFKFADKYLAKSYRERDSKMPEVINNLKAKSLFNESNFPLLYKELNDLPLTVDSKGLTHWPLDDMEVITITSPPLTQVLNKNLLAFRKKISSTGSRFQGKSCSERVGCNQSLGRDLSGFSPGMLNITDSTGSGGLSAR